MTPIGVVIFKYIIIFSFVNLLKLGKSLLGFNFEALQGLLDFLKISNNPWKYLEWLKW